MEGEGSILEVTGLEKSYGRNKVLKGVDLTVRKGEVIAIIGPSGCGKSTFIRCLNLLEEPDCGKIVYKGTDLVSADKKTRSETLKDIGMVFQQFNLFPHKTVMDNVTMAPQLVSKMSKEDAEAKAEKYLKLVGMDHKKNSYPTNLSGGQQQRVSIARALAKNPKMLLCDEPTGALDYVTGKQILKLLQDTCRKQKMTVLVITHNSAIAPMADRVIRIKNGKAASVCTNPSPVSVEDIEW